MENYSKKGVSILMKNESFKFVLMSFMNDTKQNG